MEQVTINTFLYYAAPGTGGAVPADNAFAKLCDITSYPSPDGAPERVDVSDLSHKRHLYVPGMVDDEELEFGVNYKKTDYDTVKALEKDSTTGATKKYYYRLLFGEGGAFGAWQWYGSHHIGIEGAGVGDARTGKITCYPESDIEPVTISA